MKKVIVIPAKIAGYEIRYSASADEIRIESYMDIDDLYATYPGCTRELVLAIKALAEADSQYFSPRIAAIKLIREYTNWSLKESREFMELLSKTPYNSL